LSQQAAKGNAWANKNQLRGITKAQEDDDGVAIKEFAEKDKWTIVPKSAAFQAEIIKVMEPVWIKWADDRGPEAVKTLAAVRKAVGHDK